LRDVFDKAGLPASTYVAFREILTAIEELHDEPPPYAPPQAVEGREGAGRLKRRIVERALMVCERSDIGDLDPLMILLRVFATEAAREDARVNCERLLADDGTERGRAA
jgi:hypothetical protein